MAHILPHGIKKIKNLLRERERERGKRTRSVKENRRIERPKLF